MYDNTLKWVLVGITLAMFVSTFTHITASGVLIKCHSSRLLKCHRGMMVLFIAFLPLVSYYGLSLEDFRLEVMKWQVEESKYSGKDVYRPEFDHNRWNKYGAPVFGVALSLILSLYTAYSCLATALRPAMEESAQKKQHSEESDLHPSGSGNWSVAEKPLVKRVSFDLPDLPEEKIAKFYSYFSKQLVRHARRIASFVLCAFLVTFLLPSSLQHAFFFKIAEFNGVSLTSDHVLVTFAVFFCTELVLHGFSIARPSGYSEIRFMASRFTLCYGVFLIVVSVLVLLQFNDTLKLYVYRMYEPHATFKDRPTSFYDLSIPNINTVSMVLENLMTRYSYSLILSETSNLDRSEIIRGSLNIFTKVFSDGIACVLFATMVVVPAVFSILI